MSSLPRGAEHQQQQEEAHTGSAGAVGGTTAAGAAAPGAPATEPKEVPGAGPAAVGRPMQGASGSGSEAVGRQGLEAGAVAGAVAAAVAEQDAHGRPVAGPDQVVDLMHVMEQGGWRAGRLRHMVTPNITWLLLTSHGYF